MAGSYAFYDIDELRAIPVREVCDVYGLKRARSKNMYYSPFGERTASLYLYDNNGQNRFHDFGGGRNVGGGPIELVAYIHGLEWKDAVQDLAQAFGIMPLERDKEEYSFELTDRQWSKIGIHGDLATKNFDFSFDGPNAEKRNENISNKYSMTMNELRKKNPGIYKKVLQKRAFSYMYACQQQYFRALSSEYLTMKLVGYENFEKMTKSGYEEVKRLVDQLKGCEQILRQALKGTDLKFDFHQYNIDVDFQRVAGGEMSMEVGTVPSYDLKMIAKDKQKIHLKEIEMSVSTFAKIKRLDLTLPYSAVEIKDRVFITADEKHITLFENMEKFFDFGLEVETDGLNEKIDGAKERVGAEDKGDVGGKEQGR